MMCQKHPTLQLRKLQTMWFKSISQQEWHVLNLEHYTQQPVLIIPVIYTPIIFFWTFSGAVAQWNPLSFDRHSALSPYLYSTVKRGFLTLHDTAPMWKSFKCHFKLHSMVIWTYNILHNEKTRFNLYHIWYMIMTLLKWSKLCSKTCCTQYSTCLRAFLLWNL